MEEFVLNVIVLMTIFNLGIVEANHLYAYERALRESEDEIECNRMRSKNLREVCLKIRRDPNLFNVAKGDVGLDTRLKHSELPSRMRFTRQRPRKQSRNDGGLMRKLDLIMPSCKPSTDCPSPYYIATSQKSIRTSAPWDYCEDYDPYRYPQVLNVAGRLCDHCFNPDTLQKSVNGVSRHLSVIITVLTASQPIPSFQSCVDSVCYPKSYKLHIGAYCELK